MPDRPISAIDRPRVRLFVSHAGFDKPIVRAVSTQLRALGYQVWIDEDELLPGERILLRLEEAVLEADFLILFLSDSALRSTWVDEEWRLKFEQQIGERSIRVIPVLLEDVAPLPPVLRGRLYVSGSAAVLLREAAMQIDHGILELLRRGNSSSGSWVRESLVEPATIARMRRELAEAIDALDWSNVVELLLSARAVAAAAYDAGDAALATLIYSELLLEVGASQRFWGDCPEMSVASDEVRARVSRCLDDILEKTEGKDPDRAISDRVWSARMAFDSVIEYAQAVSIIKHFVAYAKLLESKETVRRPSAFFEPLRYAVHKRKDKVEPLGSRMLEAVCAASLTLATGILERSLEAEPGKIDLHYAAILRMCRSVSSSNRELAPRRPLRTATDVVADVLYLDMMLFDTQAFIGMGDIGEEFDALMASGAAAVFDLALSNRGYPRDASYWADGSLSDASE
jgi:hypothetical protein